MTRMQFADESPQCEYECTRCNRPVWNGYRCIPCLTLGQQKAADIMRDRLDAMRHEMVPMILEMLGEHVDPPTIERGSE